MQDATVQSIPQTSQPSPVAVAPSSYVAPAPQVQQAPVAYQVGTSYPQAVPQASPNYQFAPSQYAPQSPSVQTAESTSNPWESAFNKVVNLLSAPVQSPFQAPQSAPTSYTPANYGSTSLQGMPQSAAPTSYLSQASSPSSSPTYLTGSSAAQAQAEVNEAVADYYNLSQETRQILDAFGVEAPAILNNYALQLEGMLDSAVAWGNRAADTIQGYANFAVGEHQENLAYNEILTNPDVLSDYTLKFFGPEGPYPVYESEAQLETPGYPTQQIQQPEFGQFPAPPAAAAPQQPGNFWGDFNEAMARNPQEAWRVLNHAQPQVVANKLFVME
jgi:hypothetical protein